MGEGGAPGPRVSGCGWVGGGADVGAESDATGSAPLGRGAEEDSAARTETGGEAPRRSGRAGPWALGHGGEPASGGTTGLVGDSCEAREC